MEENLISNSSFASALKDTFKVEPKDPGMYSPLVLAWIGDEVYGMVVRTLLLAEGNRPVNALNKKANSMVNAGAQAALFHSIEELCTPEELAVYHRGRNAKSYSTAKNASLTDYRHATGLEALCGWLYLSARYDRLCFLMKAGMERTGILPSMPADTSCKGE